MSIWAATYLGLRGSVIASEDNPSEAITLKFTTFEIDVQSLDFAGIEEMDNCSLIFYFFLKWGQYRRVHYNLIPRLPSVKPVRVCRRYDSVESGVWQCEGGVLLFR